MNEINLPNLEDFLKAGAHFGHKISRWHPKMKPYIFCVYGGIHIINVEKTREKLQEALEFVRNLGKEGKTLLFVGTKSQAQAIIKKYAEECGLPYVNEKWLGGTLTNFEEISKLISSYLKLKAQQSAGELAKYTKKEQLNFMNRLVKMEKKVSGILNLNKLPDALYIVDLKAEKTALKEARDKNIPVVAICDTNVDPTTVQYPIPANDDAIKSIELITSFIAQAYQLGKKEGLTQEKS